MAFFDMMDDVARHSQEKNHMGENIISGVMVGKVVKNYDKDKQGFVLVDITTRDYQESKLVWARMVLPYGGSKWGEYFIPEIDDQVLIAFEQGNIDRAFVIGAVPKANSSFMQQAFDEKNQYKRIKTRNGNLIEVIDNKEGEGEKDKITIKTAKDSHKFVLDNENKKITISDKEGKNKIEMNTENGQMYIKAEKKLTIKVGDNITMTMNGSNGTVEIKASKFKATSDETTEIKANSRVTVEGVNVNVNGNSMLKLKSDGPVSVAGTPIKLG